MALHQLDCSDGCRPSASLRYSTFIIVDDSTVNIVLIVIIIKNLIFML